MVPRIAFAAWVALSALSATLVAVPALAALPDLVPFKARYKITVNGVPAGTAATVELRSLGDTRKELTFEVQNRFFRHHETSRFDWHSCQVTAREYRHDFHGLGIDRQSAIDFDWNRRVAIDARGKERREIPLPSNMYDGLNMAMLARCQLRDGVSSLNFPVIYRGETRDMVFQVTGREKVETPIGTFDTVRIERAYEQRLKRTRVWVAPELDWFMVRFEHVENPAARGSLMLTGFTWTKDAPATAAKALPVNASPPP